MDDIERWKFEVVEISDLKNGTSEVLLELSDDFVDWFKKDQGLRRWSDKRFNSWFAQLLVKAEAAPEFITT